MKGIAHIPHHLVLFAIGLLTAFQVSAQHSCCDPSEGSATASFAALGQEDGFRAAHQTPRNFVLEDAKGANVTFLTPDGKTGGGYYVPAETDADKYLFVIHEWWGLNDHIRAEAERLQAELGDVHVLALDLYDGKVATDRQSASQYMQSVDEARAKAIIQGALNNVGAEAKVGTIGWCFGGGWSLQATLLAGSQAAGCVLYY
ncbi:MAG: dienelactone hydrolase family protein, partial [Bacteroidota bacterium]